MSESGRDTDALAKLDGAQRAAVQRMIKLAKAVSGSHQEQLANGDEVHASAAADGSISWSINADSGGEIFRGKVPSDYEGGPREPEDGEPSPRRKRSRGR